MHLAQEPHLKFAVLAVDSALFAMINERLHIRLIPVSGNPDYAGLAALPGGLVRPDETVERAAERVLAEKAALNSTYYCEQFRTFSAIDRDTRGRVVAVAFIGLTHDPAAISSANAYWLPINQLPSRLAYDHNLIIVKAMEHLLSRIESSTIIQYLLPDTFTLTELEQTFAAVLNRPIDRRNFQKKILSLAVLEELEEKRSNGPMRPARVYRFKNKEVLPTVKI
jgi:8-oxo-dGTP diphosphatase